MIRSSFAKCIVVTLLGLVSLSVVGQASKEIDALLDPVLAARELVAYDRVAVSPDGAMIAYSVRQKPEDVVVGDDRHIASGTPVTSLGAEMYVTWVGTGETVQVGPSGGNAWRPEWSPSADLLAFFCDAGGAPQLWLYDVDGGQSWRVSEQPVKAMLFDSDVPKWSSDGFKLYVPVPGPGREEVSRNWEAPVKVKVSDSSPVRDEEDRAWVLAEYGAELAAFDVETGKMSIVVAHDAVPPPSCLNLSPSADWLSYSSLSTDGGMAKFSVGVASVSTGATFQIAENLPADPGGSRRPYQWHPTRDVMLFVSDGRLMAVAFEENGPNPPVEVGAGFAKELFAEPFAVSQDGAAIVIGYDPQWSGLFYDIAPTGLAFISLDDGRSVNCILPENYSFLSVITDRGQWAWQPENDTVVIYAQNQQTNGCALVKMRYDFGSPETLEAEVLWDGYGRVQSEIQRPGQSAFIARYQDPHTPECISRFDVSTGEWEKIVEVEPRQESLAKPRIARFVTTIPTSTGSYEEVHTTILLPSDAIIGQPQPAIVSFYPGALCARSGSNSFFGTLGEPSPGFVPAALARGYAIVVPDVPLGAHGVPGNPSQEIIDALLPQLCHATDLGLIDPERIGLIGHSYGGYGVAAAISESNLFRAGAAWSGLYDLSSTFSREFFGEWWAEEGQGRMGGHPWQDVKRYIDNSPFYQADRIHTPLLLLHGEKDTVCDVSEAIRLFRALQRLGRDVRLVVYSEEGHSPFTWTPETTRDAYRRTLDFFDEKMGFSNEGSNVPPL